MYVTHINPPLAVLKQNAADDEDRAFVRKMAAMADDLAEKDNSGIKNQCAIIRWAVPKSRSVGCRFRKSVTFHSGSNQ